MRILQKTVKLDNMNKTFSLFLSLCLVLLSSGRAPAAPNSVGRERGTVKVRPAFAQAGFAEEALSYPPHRVPRRAIKIDLEKAWVLRNPLSPRVMEPLVQSAERFVSSSGGYYEAYLGVLGAYESAPESNALPVQTRALLRGEGEKVVSILKKRAWSYGGVKFNQALDFTFDVLAVVAAMAPSGAAARAASSRMAARQGLKYGGKLGGLASLAGAGGSRFSRLLVGGPWKWYGVIRVKAFMVDLVVFTAVMTPLMDMYSSLMPRLAAYEYITDWRVASEQQKALMKAFEQINRADPSEAVLSGYDGAALSETDVSDLRWKDESVKRNTLILLYAFRYLRQYLETSQDPHRDEMALLELLHLSLPCGMTYTNADGVQIEGNSGRLFYENEREEVIKQLEDMRETEEFVSRKVAPLCRGAQGVSRALCIKARYMELAFPKQIS